MRFGTASSILLLSASAALAVPNRRADSRPFDRSCPMSITPERFAQLEKTFSDSRTISGSLAVGDYPPAEIEVYWNVVAANQTYEGGWIPAEQIAEQMRVLNQDYAGTGITFKGVQVTRIISPTWFGEIVHSVIDKALQTSLKQKYRKGDAGTLNIYTIGFINDQTLGYATFPYQYSDNQLDDGVVIRHTTLPGGSLPPYNLGKTATHEVGHWLGLYHPFQGGCTGLGDGVEDTPPQSEQTSGCPLTARDTCPGGGPDSIHNYMDYSDDDCLTEFTVGQAERIRAHIAHYRGLGVPASGT